MISSMCLYVLEAKKCIYTLTLDKEKTCMHTLIDMRVLHAAETAAQPGGKTSLAITTGPT